MTTPTPAEVARAIRDGHGSAATVAAARALNAEQDTDTTRALAGAMHTAGRL